MPLSLKDVTIICCLVLQLTCYGRASITDAVMREHRVNPVHTLGKQALRNRPPLFSAGRFGVGSSAEHELAKVPANAVVRNGNGQRTAMTSAESKAGINPLHKSPVRSLSFIRPDGLRSSFNRGGKAELEPIVRPTASQEDRSVGAGANPIATLYRQTPGRPVTGSASRSFDVSKANGEMESSMPSYGAYLPFAWRA